MPGKYQTSCDVHIAIANGNFLVLLLVIYASYVPKEFPQNGELAASVFGDNRVSNGFRLVFGQVVIWIPATIATHSQM